LQERAGIRERRECDWALPDASQSRVELVSEADFIQKLSFFLLFQVPSAPLCFSIEQDSSRHPHLALDIVFSSASSGIISTFPPLGPKEQKSLATYYPLDMASSLFDMAVRACIRNVLDMYDVGELRYETIRPVLKHVSNPAQLVSLLPAASSRLPPYTPTARNRTSFTSYCRRRRRTLAKLYPTRHFKWPKETPSQPAQKSRFMVEGLPQAQERGRSRTASCRRPTQGCSQHSQSWKRRQTNDHCPCRHPIGREAVDLGHDTA
jgi:hypothetical protein